MLKPQLNHLHRHKTTSPLLLTQGKKSFIAGDDGGANPTSFLSHNTLAFPVKRHNPFRSHPNIRMLFASQIKAVASEPSTASNIKSINLKAVITVQMTVGGALSNIFTQALDDFTDMLGKSLLLELVSAEIDPKTGLMKDSIKDYAHRTGQYENEITYLAEFEVPEDFGSIGAIKIENEHHKEAFVESVVIEGSAIGPITISCNSWVHSKFDNPEKRVFFVDKVSCLPSNTPSGLKSLRETELAILRGEGVANKPREKKDRIYDYDVYNDLGDPDKDPDWLAQSSATKTSLTRGVAKPGDLPLKQIHYQNLEAVKFMCQEMKLFLK
ncbi:putative linoleate 13S-lipoxygenase [Helianthus annuus]|nr:putative linoleate 13S-lipoxygenase [Helianthus annuus]